MASLKVNTCHNNSRERDGSILNSPSFSIFPHLHLRHPKRSQGAFCTTLTKLSYTNHLPLSLLYCVLRYLAKEWEVFGRYGTYLRSWQNTVSEPSPADKLSNEMEQKVKSVWGGNQHQADWCEEERGVRWQAGRPCPFRLVSWCFISREECASQTDNVTYRHLIDHICRGLQNLWAME